MEEIYVNVECAKSANLRPSTIQTGPSSSDRRFYRAAVLCLGLLSVFLLVGLISLGVHYRDSVRDSSAELSLIKANLTERLQASNDMLSWVSEKRDVLNANLTATTKELARLQSLAKQKRSCPAGWTMFSCTCYFFSTESGSWDKSRKDCRDRGADLVVIDSSEEQKFLSKHIKQRSWIGLKDRDSEGTWKWIDETPLTLAYWDKGQPDNGDGKPEWGEEDCAHLVQSYGKWNDLSCDVAIQWICEKKGLACNELCPLPFNDL